MPGQRRARNQTGPGNTKGERLQSKKKTSRPQTSASEYSAQFAYLVDAIKDFEANLEPGQDMGVRLVSFGDVLVLRLASVLHIDQTPFVEMNGMDDQTNEPIKVIQNFSQLSLAFVVIPRLESDKPRHLIGFHGAPKKKPRRKKAAAVTEIPRP